MSSVADILAKKGHEVLVIEEAGHDVVEGKVGTAAEVIGDQLIHLGAVAGEDLVVEEVAHELGGRPAQVGGDRHFAEGFGGLEQGSTEDLQRVRLGHGLSHDGAGSGLPG